MLCSNPAMAGRLPVIMTPELWLQADMADVPSTPGPGASTLRRASGMTPRAGSVTPRRLGLSGGARRVTADADGDHTGV